MIKKENSMTEEQEPKIIIDEDWKDQVQKEKDQQDHQAPNQSGEAEIPEASFPMLVTALTTQALSAMGFVPDPVTGTADGNRPLAKHFIDSLGVLQEKTLGNLTNEENELLTESLHQLRMAYVASGQQSEAETPEDKPSIELP